MKVIARDEAPPLTDKAAWAAFPYTDYDLVILDSISAATEGVEEKDGGKAGAGLAPLLDAARKGPAVLLLANTTKDGLKIRGSGILSDRVDILYEVRDATDLKIEAKHDAWWDAVPDSGEHTWGERAKRRRRRESYRLSTVTSKFRVGEEPDPMCFEIRHDTEPWSVNDVTSELQKQLEDVKRGAADAQQRKTDEAVAALKKALPLAKNPDAVALLKGLGFSRDAGRQGLWITRFLRALRYKGRRNHFKTPLPEGLRNLRIPAAQFLIMVTPGNRANDARVGILLTNTSPD